MKKDEAAKILAEVQRCKDDFIYFAENYLKIIDKDDKLQTLKLNYAQNLIHQELESNGFLSILKARQLGSSTYIAARFFWEALFNVNTRVAVVAHTHAAVRNIYSIYQRFYSNLPKFLQLETTAASANELAFITGSSIKIGTANSQNFRGSTYSRIHASEAAFWDDMNSTIQSLFQTASNNPTIIIETTPNGLNDFYTFWKDNNGYNKLFLSWLDDKNYVRKDVPDNWKASDVEFEYLKEHGLSEQQRNWFVYTLRTRCGNNIHNFKQEYPAKVEDAFIATGTFVFPHLVKDLVEPPKQFGWTFFAPPNKYKAYLLGVDTASGDPNGDFSAAVMLDISDKDKYSLVATFYDHITLKEYAQSIKLVCEKYKPLVICERNSYGQAIIEDIRASDYPYVYSETKWDVMKNAFSDRIGFTTSAKSRPVLMAKLVETITSNKIELKCPRLRYEFLHFVYNDKGKAEAESGFHDDLIFALGLALMGEDQAYYYEEEIKKANKPDNIRDMIAFEVATGIPSSRVPDSYWAEETELDRLVGQWDDDR
jgi:hypothetical protein